MTEKVPSNLLSTLKVGVIRLKSGDALGLFAPGTLSEKDIKQLQAEWAGPFAGTADETTLFSRQEYGSEAAPEGGPFTPDETAADKSTLTP